MGSITKSMAHSQVGQALEDLEDHHSAPRSTNTATTKSNNTKYSRAITIYSIKGRQNLTSKEI